MMEFYCNEIEYTLAGLVCLFLSLNFMQGLHSGIHFQTYLNNIYILEYPLLFIDIIVSLSAGVCSRGPALYLKYPGSGAQP